MRTALLEDGRRLLEELLAEIPEPQVAPVPGQRIYADRPCQVLSIFGPVRLSRNYYYVPGQNGTCPLDAALGLLGGFTPGAARMLSRTAAQLPYEESSHQLRELAGLEVNPSQIQRLVQQAGNKAQLLLPLVEAVPVQAEQRLYISVDGTGVPMSPDELEGRAGRGPDGIAKTREIKLAALFTQTALDEQGQPVRDESSTTYLASFAPAQEFALQVRQAALSRCFGRAAQTVFIGDGAAWVWELARTCFPDAVQILDFYHAAEHVCALAKAVYPEPALANNWALCWKAHLYDGEVDEVLRQARAVVGDALSEAVQSELDYLQRHRPRMDYGHYRAQGLFIGSGVVEAGCKRVIGQRLKQSGMFWCETGAAAVATLRAALLSAQTWDPLWDRLLAA